MLRVTAADDAAEAEWIARIRRQDPHAWQSLIAAYQGRLLAFADHRLHDRALAEDVVQETFLGLLLALPNYDARTRLEAFLFSIAAHKLTDALRRRGSRPLLSGWSGSTDDPLGEPASRQRRASSLAVSAERQSARERVLGDCLQELVQQWYSRGELERLACVELLLCGGRSNKDAAACLGISEQAVANHKSFALQKLKAAAATARLRDVDWSSWDDPPSSSDGRAGGRESPR
jgi:RNA polymerase sigma-70 factor (ECF subfamily)